MLVLVLACEGTIRGVNENGDDDNDDDDDGTCASAASAVLEVRGAVEDGINDDWCCGGRISNCAVVGVVAGERRGPPLLPMMKEAVTGVAGPDAGPCEDACEPYLCKDS